MKMLRVVLTRAEVLAMHLAMGLLWIEHKLDHDPDARPLRSALMKFNTALGPWDGESSARLVLVAGKNGVNQEHIKLDVRSLPALVQRKVPAGEVHVQWNCFCKSPLESCQFCRGCGYVDQWLPANMLTYLKERTYHIRGHRNVQATPAC